SRIRMSLKQITLKEVSEHNSMKSLWFVIGNKVYDVTKFVDEHPGGCEVLLEQAGKDATEAFEDVGHSTDARAMKEEYIVGEIVEEERKLYSYDKKPQQKWNTDKDKDNKVRNQNGPLDALVTPALIAIAIALVYYLLLA
ncbi:cytb-5.1, partial [Pristionchus pacificus]